MKERSLFILALLAGTLFAVSCEKEGEPGPAGPEGPQGPKGDTGTANVMYSDWFRIDNPSVSGNLMYYYQEFSVPQIDQDFIGNGGAVLVYHGVADNGDLSQIRDIRPLPDWGKEGYKNIPDDSAVYYEMDYAYSEGKLTVGFTVTDGEEKITSNQYFFHHVWTGIDQYFRYILIPGGVMVNGKAAAPADFTDYELVKDYYSLAE